MLAQITVCVSVRWQHSVVFTPVYVYLCVFHVIVGEFEWLKLAAVLVDRHNVRQIGGDRMKAVCLLVTLLG